MRTSSANDRIFLLASALTKLHPGAGRSPGVVDLPVIRDPLGYPFIPGTMLKGSLRSALHRAQVDKTTLECLFGSEQDQDRGVKKPGMLTFHDLYLLFVPAPSDEYGVLYVTSQVLLSRTLEMAELGNLDSDVIETLKNLVTLPIDGVDALRIVSGASCEGVKSIFIGNYEITTKCKDVDLGKMQELIEDSHALYNSLNLDGRLLIVKDKLAPAMIESLLLRMTRVRLDRKTKTVQSGGLWTEEYIPWGSLLAGIVVYNGLKPNGCEELFGKVIEKFKHEVFGNNTSITINLGGKETVGSGFVRLRFIEGRKVN